MQAGQMKEWVQSVFGRFGYQIRRMEANVTLDNAYAEQKRLVTNSAQTIIEVGAADGRDSQSYCNDYPRATVYAFEPMPGSYEKLAAKATETGERLKTYQAAVSDKKGTATFFVAEWQEASSLLKPAITGSNFDAYHATRQEIEVAVETLDGFCAANNIESVDILKLDAQGAELKILEGAKSLISNGKIGLIYTEIQFVELYQGAAQFWQVWQFLAQYGYALHNIYNINHNHEGKICWGDAIFIKLGK